MGIDAFGLDGQGLLGMIYGFGDAALHGQRARETGVDGRTVGIDCQRPFKLLDRLVGTVSLLEQDAAKIAMRQCVVCRAGQRMSP